MKKNILLVGGSYAVCDRIAQPGVDVFLFHNRNACDPASLASVRTASYFNYEDGSVARDMAAALHGSVGLDAVLSTEERGLRLASIIAEDIGVSGMPPPSIVDIFQDKLKTRQVLHESSFESVWSETVRDSKTLDSIRRSRQGPVIVKPREGSGSDSINLLRPDDPVFELVDGRDYVVEEFLDGPEFSVESFSFEGQHVIFGVTQKINYGESMANPYLETGHVVPALIPDKTFDLIADYISELLNVLGLRDGPAHTEVRLTALGPRLIETHPRIGGDFITELVRLTTGYDLTQLSAAWPLRLCEPPVNSIKWRGAAAVKYFGADTGVVQSINRLDAVRGHPNVRHVKFKPAIGQSIRQSMTETVKSSDRIGSVLCVGDSPQAAIEHCERAVEQIGITIASDNKRLWHI